MASPIEKVRLSSSISDPVRVISTAVSSVVDTATSVTVGALFTVKKRVIPSWSKVREFPSISKGTGFISNVMLSPLAMVPFNPKPSIYFLPWDSVVSSTSKEIGFELVKVAVELLSVKLKFDEEIFPEAIPSSKSAKRSSLKIISIPVLSEFSKMDSIFGSSPFERINSISSKKVVFPFEEEVVSNWIQRGVFSSIPDIVAISNNLDLNSIKSPVFENDPLSATHESFNTGASK